MGSPIELRDNAAIVDARSDEHSTFEPIRLDASTSRGIVARFRAAFQRAMDFLNSNEITSDPVHPDLLLYSLTGRELVDVGHPAS